MFECFVLANSCSPQKIDISVRIHKAFGGDDASILLTEDGRILVCGSNNFCKIGFPSSCRKLHTFCFLNNIEEEVEEVNLNSESTVLLCKNGYVIMMGKCGNWVYSSPQKIFLPYTNLSVSIHAYKSVCLNVNKLLQTIGLGENFLAFGTEKLVNMTYFGDEGILSQQCSEKSVRIHSRTIPVTICLKIFNFLRVYCAQASQS